MTVRSGNFQILDSKDIESLRTIREISSGASGRVLEVGKEEKLALKVMHVGESTISSFKEFIGEYEKLCHLNHPNILRAFGIFLSDEQNPPSILLELCEQNLSTAIKKSSPTQVEIILWIYQISEAMKYVHKNSLIHRDLKPTNILIGKDSKIRIGDFGISKLMTSEEQSTILGSGTQKFMAPELLKEEKYDEKVDVYSFGVVVFFLLSGGQMPKINIIQVGNGKKAKIPDSFSTFAKELINNCWNYKPKERPSFESILSILEKNDYELFELSKSEKNEIRSFVKNHKKLISDYNDQSKKIDLVQKKVDDDENRPIISPVFSSAVSKFSSNDQFAILCSLLIQNASSLITDPQSTLLCKNFNKDSDLVTILDSICEMSEKYPKKNINSGFNLLTVDSIYQTIKPESVVKAVKWSRKTKEGTFGMVEKFINLLDDEFIEKRKCEFVHVINARPESVPELVYKTKDRKKVHIYQRPGSLGLQCPGNVIVLSMSPNEKNNEIYYGMIIHNQNKEKTDIKQGVVSSEFLYNKFYFPLFENYTFNLFNSTNFIEMYQTTEPNKRYSLFVYIDHNKGYLSYCPRSEKIYKSIKNSLEFLNSLLPFVPRSIISKLDNPNCVVEINGYGSSNSFTTSIHLENDLPSAYPLNKKALEFAAKNIIDLRKDVPSIRFAITGESLIYKNANNIDDDFELEIPIPDASLSIQSVFDPNHPTHLILLVDKKYKNKPDIKPLSWIYKAENHEIYKFKWNLDKLANPEILAKNLEEDTTCTFICEPPSIYLPQPIYAYQKDGSVKTISICKKCLIEYFKNIEDIQNSIDSVNKKFKFNKSIKLNVIMPGLPFASDESDKKGITWPQIPIGQGIFAILSDIKEFGAYIKTWLTLIVRISYEKTIKLTHCPNHPDVFYEKPESGINIKCPKCDMFLCASCNSWHKMSDKCSSELNGIKKCPNCGTPSYKVSGSNKISCPCGKHWCYKCNKSEIYQTPDEVYKHMHCMHGGYYD